MKARPHEASVGADAEAAVVAVGALLSVLEEPEAAFPHIPNIEFVVLLPPPAPAFNATVEVASDASKPSESNN